ncbi:MAG TPA: hypothetical protein VGO61_04855 [Steroidobacteraceae bacterium]|jgi:hypothetical protein|nr:hypothetical protein [Steroidobacteraceae bacterium]
MKRTFVFLGVIAALAMLSAAANAQETTLQVGKFGQNPGTPNVVPVSTATVDAWLQLLSPGSGAHYTRDRANAMFADANAVVTQLQTSLLPAIQQAPHIQSVNSILVGANPLNVRIAQSGAGLRATVSGLSATVSVNLTYSAGPFCSTMHGHFRVRPVLSTEYSYASGLLQGSSVYVPVDNIDVSCTGIFSDFTNSLINAFAGGYIKDLVTTSVQNAATSQLDLIDGHQIFSAFDFLEGLRIVSNYGYLDAVTNDIINRAQSIVANPAGLNNYYQVDINVSQAPSGNVVRILASHTATSQVTNISYPGMNTVIDVYRGPDTGRVEIVYRYPAGSGAWHYTGYTDTDTFRMQGSMPINTEFGAVGISTHSANLRSEVGGITMITNFDPRCTHNCPPREIE